LSIKEKSIKKSAKMIKKKKIERSQKKNRGERGGWGCSRRNLAKIIEGKK